jgi:hypothetical protein
MLLLPLALLLCLACWSILLLLLQPLHTHVATITTKATTTTTSVTTASSSNALLTGHRPRKATHTLPLCCCCCVGQHARGQRHELLLLAHARTSGLLLLLPPSCILLPHGGCGSRGWPGAWCGSSIRHLLLLLLPSGRPTWHKAARVLRHKSLPHKGVAAARGPRQ